MLAVQIGIIAFLLLLLAAVNSEEKKKHRQERKLVKANEFWCGTVERRQTIRIDTELEVLYEVITETPANNHKASICKNVSLGGINLVLNEKLLPETKIYLQLNLPGQNKTILTEGEIIWEKEMPQDTAQKDDSERFFNEGIRFVHIKKEDKDILGNFIQTHHPNTE
ncbi:MAG: PilZ domain-containing protein [Candidatus Firestonebacteria bacterium]